MDLAGPKDTKIKGRNRLFWDLASVKGIHHAKPQVSIVSSTDMMLAYEIVTKVIWQSRLIVNRLEKLRGVEQLRGVPSYWKSHMLHGIPSVPLLQAAKNTGSWCHLTLKSLMHTKWFPLHGFEITRVKLQGMLSVIQPIKSKHHWV